MLRSLTGFILATGLMLIIHPVLAESPYDDDEEPAVDPKLALPVVQDLASLGNSTRGSTVPILLMFATEECEYCKRLESDVLGPLRLSGADPAQVIVRKVMLESYESIRDFSGIKRGAESFGDEKGVSVVPTVVLLDGKGLDLVPKIVGYQATGFYESYLNEAIKVSTLLLKQR